MSNLTRFDSDDYGVMYPHSDGDWCEYKEATKRIAELEDKLTTWRGHIEGLLLERIAELEDVLYRHGFTRCDIPACNCNSWHQTGGFAKRFAEIDEATNDYWHNGETLLGRIKRVVADSERLRAVYEATKKFYESGWDIDLHDDIQQALAAVEGCSDE